MKSIRNIHIYLLLFLIFSITSCRSKKQFSREDRYLKKIERKEMNQALKSHKKQYKAWFKLQAPEIQKRLKEQKKETNKFYKKYGSAKTNVTPRKHHYKPKKYRRDGIK